MKPNYRIKKSVSKRSDNREILLISLAFLFGLLLYFILSNGIISRSDSLPVLLVSENSLSGYVFLLIILQLTSFSVIGSVEVLILDCVFGFYIAVCLGTIIPDAISTAFVIKAFIFVLLAFFLSALMSSGAYFSSLRLRHRCKGERRVFDSYVLLVALAVIFIVLSAIGFTDVNILF